MGTDKNKKSKLNQLNDERLNNIHSEDLGLKVPRDYFSKSKNEIFSRISKEKEPKRMLFSRKSVMWTVAASIALVFGLTVFNQYSNPQMNELPLVVSDTIDRLKIENLPLVLSDTNIELIHKDLNSEKSTLIDNDVLVKSLFVEDNDMEQYIVNYMLEDI